MKREFDKFHLMKVFHAVAIKGSFTKGAHELGMTVSSVSKAVQQLERLLKTKLMYRTTRTQSLTDSGREYLNVAQNMLSDLKGLEERLIQKGSEPSGLLKIAAPTAIGQLLIGPKLHEFMKANPKIKIDMVLSDRLVDITDEGFDIAVRSKDAPKTSPLYSVRLGAHRRKLVASPEYVKDCHMLTSPEQLSDMALLTYTKTLFFPHWTFSREGQEVIVDPDAIFTSNNYYTLYLAAKNGAGIANLHHYMVDDDIKEGHLVHLLPEWQQPERDLFAIYHQRRDLSPKLDVFLQFLTGLFH